MLTCGGAAFVVAYSQVPSASPPPPPSRFKPVAGSRLSCSSGYVSGRVGDLTKVWKPLGWTLASHASACLMVATARRGWRRRQDEALKTERLDFLGLKDEAGARHLMALGRAYAARNAERIDRHFGAATRRATARRRSLAARRAGHRVQTQSCARRGVRLDQWSGRVNWFQACTTLQRWRHSDC